MTSTVPVGSLAEHPDIATIIPNLSDTEYARLKDAIEQSGRMEPLIVWAQDLTVLLDGRHRLRVAKDTGMTEVPVVAEDGDPLTIAIRWRIARGHNTEGQVAMMVTAYRKANPDASDAEAAEATGTSRETARKTRTKTGEKSKADNRARDPEVEAAIKAGLAEGKSQRAVAREVGVSEHTVRRVAKGLQPVAPKPDEKPKPSRNDLQWGKRDVNQMTQQARGLLANLDPSNVQSAARPNVHSLVDYVETVWLPAWQEQRRKSGGA